MKMKMKSVLLIAFTTVISSLSINAHAKSACGIGYVTAIYAGALDDGGFGLNFRMQITKPREVNPAQNRIGDTVRFKMNNRKNMNDAAGQIYYKFLNNAMLMGTTIEAWDEHGTECDDIHQLAIERQQ